MQRGSKLTNHDFRYELALSLSLSLYIYIYIYMCVRVCVRVCVSIYIFVRVYICSMYIYMNIICPFRVALFMYMVMVHSHCNKKGWLNQFLVLGASQKWNTKGPELLFPLSHVQVGSHMSERILCCIPNLRWGFLAMGYNE